MLTCMQHRTECHLLLPPPEFALIEQLRQGPHPVYRARLGGTGKMAHLKLVRDRRSALRAARALRRVASPFVAPLLGVWRQQECRWIASEWMAGSALDVATQDLRVWLPGLVRGLVHLHRHGVVHGDLKPDNVLVEPASGRVVLVDFEFAARIGEQPAFAEAGGTEGFVAPERLCGWPADPRSDLFAVGRIMLAGPALPPALADLAAALVSPRPADRPADAATLLAHLTQVLGSGWIPPPDLALIGWRQPRITADDLSIGVARAFDCSTALAQRLADALIGLSGGQRDFAAALWQAWLPRITPDPWCPLVEEKIEAGISLLRQLAIELAQRRIAALGSELRAFAANVAQGGIAGLQPAPETGQKTESTLRAELLAAGILRGSAATAGSPGYRFVNPPLWGAALAAADPARRRDRHARLARSRPSPEPEPLDAGHFEALAAWHLEEAGEPEKALRVWFRAARKMLDRGENAAALRFATHAWWLRSGRNCGPAHGVLEPYSVIADEPSPEPPSTLPDAAHEEEFLSRIELFSALLALAGHIDAALAWIESIPRLLRSPRAMALYHTNMARQLERAGRWEQMRRHAEQGLRSAAELADPALEGRLRMHRAQALIAARSLDRGQREALRAAALLESENRPADQSTALQLAAIAALRQHDTARVREQLETALDLAQRAGAAFVIAAAHMNLSVFAHSSGQLEPANHHLRAALAIARQRQLPQIRWAALANLGVFAMRAERWSESSAYWSEALALATRAGRAADLLHAAVGLVQAQLRAGFLARVERVLQQTARRFPPATLAPALRLERLRLALRQIELYVLFRRLPADAGHVREARELAQQVESEPIAVRLRVALAAQILLDATGPPAAARAALGARPSEAEPAGWYHIVEARILAREGDGDAADAAIGAALQAFATLHPGRFETACAWLERAHLAHDPKRRADALEQCIVLARAVRARWIEAQALLLRTSPPRPLIGSGADANDR